MDVGGYIKIFVVGPGGWVRGWYLGGPGSSAGPSVQTHDTEGLWVRDARRGEERRGEERRGEERRGEERHETDREHEKEKEKENKNENQNENEDENEENDYIQTREETREAGEGDEQIDQSPSSFL
ncbi:hypothetical protein WAI453_010639 [Rhynchosporium graminicola]